MSAKSMANIWKAMEKNFGEEGLYAGNGNLTTYSEAIPTGSPALDDALGIWGVPAGHIVQYAGYESSGKTLLSFTTIAEWQKKDPRNWAMFVDAEFTYDKIWAESLGVDTSRLYLYRENKAAEVFNRICGVPNKPDKRTGLVTKSKPGVLDLEIDSGGTGLGVIVIDSIAALQPPMEEGSKAGKANIALLARFLPPELRKVTPMLTETGVTLIAINQIRFKPDVMYGDPTDSPGGTALKHSCAQMINFGVMGGKDNIIEEDGERVGHKIRAKVQKNKKAPPFRTAEFYIKYTEGVVNKQEEILGIGARYGIIQRVSNRVWELDGEKYNGKGAIMEVLKDEEVQNSILERAKEAKEQFRLDGVSPTSAQNVDMEEDTSTNEGDE